jgi:hypothetical protein
MAGNKYIAINSNGIPEEVISNQTSAGAGDAGKIVALNALGEIDNSMLPNVEALSVILAEDVISGNMINLFDDAGTLKARKADGSTNKYYVDGFVKVSGTAGASIIVYGEGVVPKTGLTPGARYFLSTTTPGDIVTSVTTTAGTALQYVGKATSATTLLFEKDEPVIRA